MLIHKSLFFYLRNNQQHYYVEFKKKFCDIGLQLATSAQRDTFAENPVSKDIRSIIVNDSRTFHPPEPKVHTLCSILFVYRCEKSLNAAKDWTSYQIRLLEKLTIH